MKNSKKSVIFLALIFVFQLIVPAFCLTYERNKQNELDEKGEEYKLVIDFARFSDGVVYFDADALREVIDYTVHDSDDVYVTFEKDKYGVIANCSTSAEKPDTPAYITLQKLTSLYYNDYCSSYESSVTRNAVIKDDWDVLYEREVIDDVKNENVNEYSYAVIKVYKNRMKVTNVIIQGTPVDEYIKRVQADDAETYLDSHPDDYEIM